MNEKINQNWPEFIKHLFNEKVPFLQSLKMEVIETSNGFAKITMPVDPSFANTYGILHGGMTAALVDTVIGVTLRTLKYKLVTIEMSTTYYKPVSLPNTLTAIGTLIKGGKTILHGKAEIFNSSGDLVAEGKAIYYITGDDDGVYPINS